MHGIGEPDTTAFYIDNCQVWRTPTPQDGSYTSNPMFLFLLTGAIQSATAIPIRAR
jgi:hypothetical protein